MQARWRDHPVLSNEAALEDPEDTCEPNPVQSEVRGTERGPRGLLWLQLEPEQAGGCLGLEQYHHTFGWWVPNQSASRDDHQPDPAIQRERRFKWRCGSPEG
jgi:hypothetical protein